MDHRRILIVRLMKVASEAGIEPSTEKYVPETSCTSIFSILAARPISADRPVCAHRNAQERCHIGKASSTLPTS